VTPDRVSPVPDIIEAAVLIPVYRDAQAELRVVLLRRAEGGPHGGQIAFPGGKIDAIDASPRAAALREADEEIGLPPANATVLEELDLLETRTTGYRIHPFLARIERPAEWRMAVREVAEVLEPRIADLADPRHHDSAMERFPQWPEAVRIDFIRIGPWRLWGITHRILRPLLSRLARGDWPV